MSFNFSFELDIGSEDEQEDESSEEIVTTTTTTMPPKHKIENPIRELEI